MSRNAAQPGVAADELLAVARTSQLNASIVRPQEDTHGNGASPAQQRDRQIERFLARYTPAFAKLTVAVRRKMRRRFPSAVELIYDNYNALVFGYGPSERASEAVFSIAAYPRWVNLFFLRGAHLPDPDGLLRGQGRLVRSFVLNMPADLDAPALQKLMRQAVGRAPVPFGSGRGRTVIRSVSPVRRARRPSSRAVRRPRTP